MTSREVKAAAEKIAAEELNHHLVVTVAMSEDPRLHERPWRNPDGTWRWRSDEELPPLEPEAQRGCPPPCGGTVFSDGYGGFTCATCHRSLLDSQLVQIGERQASSRRSGSRVRRVTRMSPEEARDRGINIF